MTKQVTKLM